MYCMNCGSSIEKGDSFCKNCGAPVTGPDGMQSIKPPEYKPKDKKKK